MTRAAIAAICQLSLCALSSSLRVHSRAVTVRRRSATRSARPAPTRCVDKFRSIDLGSRPLAACVVGIMAAARCVASTSRAAFVDAAAPRALRCSCGTAGPRRPRSSRALSTSIQHRSGSAVSALPARRSLSSTSRLGATAAQTEGGRGEASLPLSMLGGASGGSPSQLAPDVVLPTSMLAEPDLKRLKRMRNIGISAHVDSGKVRAALVHWR